MKTVVSLLVLASVAMGDFEATYQVTCDCESGARYAEIYVKSELMPDGIVCGFVDFYSGTKILAIEWGEDFNAWQSGDVDAPDPIAWEGDMVINLGGCTAASGGVSGVLLARLLLSDEGRFKFWVTEPYWTTTHYTAIWGHGLADPVDYGERETCLPCPASSSQTRPLKIDHRPDPVVATYLDGYGQMWRFGEPDVIVIEFPDPVHAVHVDVDAVGGFMLCEMLNGYRFAVTPMAGDTLSYVLEDDVIRLVELHGGGFSNLVAE